MLSNKIGTNERKEITDYLSLDIDQLYSLIGASERYDSEPDISGWVDNIQIGKELFKKLENSIHQKICVEWQICRKLDNPEFQDLANLVVEIAVIIAGIGTKIPLLVIASLIVKIGVRKFCNSHSEDSRPGHDDETQGAHI